MKFIFISLLIFSFNLNIFSEANDSIKTTTPKWYIEIIKKIKNKLAKIINPQKSSSVSSVFGVRGNNYDLKNGLYWKTENSAKLDEKIKKDKETIDLILKKIDEGNLEDARLELNDFIKNNPESRFNEEAKEILENITQSAN